MGLDLTCIKDMDNIEDRTKTVTKIIKSITSNTTNDVIARKKRVDNMSKIFNQTSLLLTKPNVFITNKSYKDVEIKPNSVIYCDPPYNNSRKYVCTSINYDEFYNWCLQQKQPLFISEYSMPDDFVCIKEIKRNFSVYTTSQTVALEKVFRPKSQV